MTDRFLVRNVHGQDLEEISRIENASILNPWSKKAVLEAIQHYPTRIIELDGKIAGFMIYSVVLDEAELFQIAVDPACRRKGLAYALLTDLELRLRDKKISKCLLEVRESNEAARNLYLKFGFKEKGKRKNYYPTPTGRESALLMEYSINA